jgi:two-component system sensor histidine kinase YesM
MITYLLLTVIPISLLGYFSFVQYTRSIETQVGKYVPRILHQANANIDRALEEFIKLTDLIYSSREVMTALRTVSYPSQSEFLQDRFTVESFLSQTYLSGNYRDVLAVFIVSENRLFANSRLAYADFDFQNPVPYGRGFDLRDKFRIVLPDETNLRFEGDVPYLLIVRQIADFDNRRSLGTLFLAVTLGFMDDILQDIAEREAANLWVMNDDGRIVYHTDPEMIGTFYPDVYRFPIKSGSFKKTDGGGAELFSVSVSQLTGWTLVHQIPIKALTSLTDRTLNAVIVIFVLFVIVTGSISIFIAWNFTRPLNRLSRLMRDVQRGNFEVDFQIDSRDEVGMLAHRFNDMVKEIRNLIRENYQIELKQKEAELYALQFQINPHFMYNTLEAIAMSVEDGEKEKVVEMVTLLGRMLRFSLSNRRRTVTIAEEIRHAEDYLRIQKYRFEDALEYDIRSSIEADRYETPKFVLQPVLENGIKHGLEHRKRVRIEIDIVKLPEGPEHPGAIRFVIRDNGIGMSPEQLAQVRRKLQDLSFRRDSSFGLANVHSRIVLTYGKPFGLMIDSREGQGTETTIVIPILPHEGEQP